MARPVVKANIRQALVLWLCIGAASATLVAPKSKCTGGFLNCLDSRCCADPGKRCYRKHDDWAMCNETCSQHMIWRAGVWEVSAEKAWQCDDLSVTPKEKSCTKSGEDCMGTGCCSDPDMKCYKQHESFAMCNKTCSRNSKFENGDWVQTNQQVWDCGVLDDVSSKATCEGGKKRGENCLSSKCCADPSLKCFKQHEHFAMCNRTCSQFAKFTNGSWSDGWTKEWSCEVLGAESKPSCKGPKKSGDNCMDTMCCADPEQKCFTKDSKWASCNATCSPYVDFVNSTWSASDHKVWDCEVLPRRHNATCPGAKRSGENCMDTRCCADPSMQCFTKDKTWASCNATCSPNVDFDKGTWSISATKEWECDVLKYSPPTCEKPHKAGENCMDSKCCADPAMTCYKKDDAWASCNATCSPQVGWVAGMWLPVGKEEWNCTVLTPHGKEEEEEEEKQPTCKGARKSGENCLDTACCADPDSKCFKKDDSWASCNKTCAQNVSWQNDIWTLGDRKVWDCDVVTHPVKVKRRTCKWPRKGGENCMTARCCDDPDMKCFKKDESWASCNATCSQKVSWEAGIWMPSDKKEWDCTVLPYREWKPTCEDPKDIGDNCLDTGCCAAPDTKCYRKNEIWASCNKTCSPHYSYINGTWGIAPEKVWDCSLVEPPAVSLSSVTEDKKADTAQTSCKGAKGAGENCMVSGCCRDPAMKCFKKDSVWASCNATCAQHSSWSNGAWRISEAKVWDCTVLSPSASGSGGRAASEKAGSAVAASAEKASVSREAAEKPAEASKASREMATAHASPVSSSADASCGGGSARGENCTQTGCCADGLTCFRKNEHWAACNKTCDPQVWQCGELTGSVTTVAPLRKEKREPRPSKPACASTGEDCAESRCCAEPGMKCFKQDGRAAVCNETCHLGGVREGGKIRTCDVLTPDGETLRLQPGCSPQGSSCAETRCCIDPSLTCFRKHGQWSMCNSTCSSNSIWRNGVWEISPDKAWDCDVLTPENKREGADKTCQQPGENCKESRCCADPGLKCFRRDEHWATCNETCAPEMQWENGIWVQQDKKLWACDVLQPEKEQRSDRGGAQQSAEPPQPTAKSRGKLVVEPAQAAQPTVAAPSKCSQNVDNCYDTRCCAEAGMKCFLQQGTLAMCNSTCNQRAMWKNGAWEVGHQKVWECKELSPPGAAAVPATAAPAEEEEEEEAVADARPVDCKQYGENCMDVKCCVDHTMSCYKKDDLWATCNTSCSQHALWKDGRWVEDSQRNWMCDVLTHPAALSAETKVSAVPPPPPVPVEPPIVAPAAPTAQEPPAAPPQQRGQVQPAQLAKDQNIFGVMVSSLAGAMNHMMPGGPDGEPEEAQEQRPLDTSLASNVQSKVEEEGGLATFAAPATELTFTRSAARPRVSRKVAVATTTLIAIALLTFAVSFAVRTLPTARQRGTSRQLEGRSLLRRYGPEEPDWLDIEGIVAAE